MKINKFENENITEKMLYEYVTNLIDELREKEIGFKLKTSIDRKIIHKLFIMLENDGMLIDRDNNVIIWDKKEAAKYKAQINSICKRNCCKNEKGACSGCREYLATTKLNGHIITEEIVLNVA